jgi:hypothetical protein
MKKGVLEMAKNKKPKTCLKERKIVVVVSLSSICQILFIHKQEV